MDLAIIQQQLRDALLAHPTDTTIIDAAAALVNTTPGLSGAEHIAIYQRAVLGTLVRALAAIYPVCRQITGPEFFDAMARRHARATPSRSSDLGAYGDTFPEFIAGFAPAAGMPYLADTARLEWCWHRAIAGPDSPRLDFAALASAARTNPGHIRLHLPASAALLAPTWPVHRIWAAHQPGAGTDMNTVLDVEAQALIVWRQGLDVRIDTPGADAWRLLAALQAGSTLDNLAGTHDLAALLPHCVANGWIAAFAVDATH